MKSGILKKTLCGWATFLFVCIVLFANAQTAQEIEKLVADTASYRYGKNRQPLVAVEELIKKTQDASLRRVIERALSKQLLAPESTLECKEFICRQLWYLGTAESVPAVATLLKDEETAGWACYALVRNPAKEAATALMKALSETESPKIRLAVISALGERREQTAVNEIAKFTQSQDIVLKMASINALGLIGSEEAFNVLNKMRPSADEKIRIAVLDSCIRCAQSLAHSGKQKEALNIFKLLFTETQDEPIKIAAFTGIVENSEKDAVDYIINALKDNNVKLRKAAIKAISLLRDTKELKKLADNIQNFPSDSKALLINMLAEKRQTAILPAIKKALADQDSEVRLSAIKAIGYIGDTTFIPALLEVINTGAQIEKELARTSLRKLSGNKVDKELVSFLSTAKAETQIEIINALTDRGATSATPALIKLAETTHSAAVKKSIFKALAQLAEPDSIPALLRVLIKMEGEDGRQEAETAIIEVSRKIADPEKRAQTPITMWKETRTDAARASLLRVISGAGAKSSLSFLEKYALSKDNQTLRDVAIRELVNWENPSAINVLETIYKTASEDVYRALALRAYVRLLSAPSDRTPKETVSMYSNALKYARSADDRKLILAGLGNTPSIESLQIALPLVSDKSIQAEAAQAVLQIATSIYGSNKNVAKDAIQTLLTTVTGENTRKQAQEILKKIDQIATYITEWEIAGPYFKDGADYRALFDIPFPPEQSDDKNVKWRIIPAGTDLKRPWLMDLLKFIGGEQRVAYARTKIYSAQDQPAKLELGTDDGVKVWLNGKLIHANNVARPLTPGSDKLNLELKKGWNTLLLKITQNNLGWEFCARIVKPDGAPLENVRCAVAGE